MTFVHPTQRVELFGTIVALIASDVVKEYTATGESKTSSRYCLSYILIA